MPCNSLLQQSIHNVPQLSLNTEVFSAHSAHMGAPHSLHFATAEGYVNKYRSDYYEALYASSQGWYFNKNDYMPYIGNFALMLYMCYTDLHTRIDLAENAGTRKADRILALLKTREPMSKAQIHEYFPDLSVSTIESALAELVHIGEIEKIGSNKNAAYRITR